MKILMVSMPSLHFFRWTDQLKDSGHEVYWFDITGAGEIVDRIGWVEQIVDWKLKYNFPGRYVIKRHFPKRYQWLQQFNERDTATVFERHLNRIQPDVVHSFVFYMSCVPIFNIMQKFRDIKWIYSAWGNDLYYYQNISFYKKNMLNILPHLDFMFADCKRDLMLAIKLGFSGMPLGNFPGGGGYHVFMYNDYIKDLDTRNIILIKGYEQRFGKCSVVLQAISSVMQSVNNYRVIVFGADKELQNYLKKNAIHKDIEVLGGLTHDEVLKIMGQSLLYIGNSLSDGIPNTLLEAIIMGAFPIQSNPGGATAEIIDNNENGLLIENCENPEEIAQLIIKAISNPELIEKAFQINQGKIKPQLERELIKTKVLEAYQKVFEK